ncbi:hypothetical protein ALC57_15466 [Trachymyrmex cornetzi]|uniref:Chromo domain-containing protein n=1 Tax=Trachymyrmex cornetzi TaxID=471704 RepID=A0A151IX48_9HYME|nr:hypothetical protein ALC57_15466 [Trachymyrmex cornetzi]
MPLRRDDSDEIEKSRSLIESLRNYVHDSELCLNPDHYDGKKRKIEHVAAPEFDTDAVNKSYVERTLQDTRNEIEELCGAIRNDMGKIVRALRDTQKDISNDVEKVRTNVEEISKSVSALSTKVSNEIQRGVTDLRQQLHNIATKEMLETDEIQRGVTDLRQQMNNTVTKETLEKSFKTTGRDIIVRALQDMQKDSLKVYSDMEKRVFDAITHLTRDVTVRMKNVVTNEILEHHGVSDLHTIFEKGYTPNRSTEIFYIVKTQRTNPATYLLKDYQGKPIAGGFYEHELQRVSNPDVYLVEEILRKRGNKVNVKWLGMDSSHYSWIDKMFVL